jgi:threonine dehydratase
MLSFEDILAAHERIRPYLYETPLEPAPSLGEEVFLKLECQQKQRSFKTRGALARMSVLRKEERQKGVAAVSSGNHGAGVSYAAGVLGIGRALVFVPRNVPGAKAERIRRCGAELVALGDNYDETHRLAMERIRQSGLTYIDPCSDPVLIAGQGTVGLEILRARPDIDVIVVPVGGGGMITGIGVAARAINPRVRVVGVQTAACPAMVRSLEDGVCYGEFPSEDSVCDALIGGVGAIPFAMAGRCVDQMLTVSESDILRAASKLLLEEKAVAEPSGAVGAAAVLAHPELFAGQKVAVVVSGGNADGTMVARLAAGA